MTATDATATTPPATPASTSESDETTHRLFSTTVLISAVRCLLTYIVFPWLLPLFGLAKSVGPGVGLAVGTIAIFFNVLTIRRFHRADHRWKWAMTAVCGIVIALLAVLAVQDVADLL